MPARDILNRLVNEKKVETIEEFNKTLDVHEGGTLREVMSFRSPLARETLDDVIDFHNKRVELIGRIESDIEKDPELGEDLRQSILTGAPIFLGSKGAERIARFPKESIRDPFLRRDIREALIAGTPGLRKEAGEALGSAISGTFSALMLPNAIVAGSASSLIQGLKAKPSTPLDTINKFSGISVITSSEESRKEFSKDISERLGFSRTLEVAGVPELGRFQFLIPRTKRGFWLGPVSFISGLVEKASEGKFPVELVPFGPQITGRGVVGLALDFMLDPLVYLKFLPKIPVRMQKEGLRPLIQFGKATILNEKEFMEGLRALRMTRAGGRILEAIDRFIASDLAQTINHQFRETFDPSYGIPKFIWKEGRKVFREIEHNTREKIRAFVRDFEGISVEDRVKYFNTIFETMRKESKIRKKINQLMKEGKPLEGIPEFPQVKFDDPRLQRIYEKETEFFRGISRRLGYPAERLYRVYIGSIIRKSLGESFKGGMRSLRRLPILDAFKKKQFITENLIRDPLVAYSVRATELIRAERLINGFIKPLIRRFGVIKEIRKKAEDAGLEEFLRGNTPVDFKTLRQTFRGSSFQKSFALSPVEKEFSLKEGEKLYLPNEIIAGLDKFARQHQFTGNKFLRLLDNFTARFKTSVTLPFPQFHMLNMRGNFLQRFNIHGFKAFSLEDNWEALKMARNDKDLGIRTITTRTGKVYSLKKVKRELSKRGLLFERSNFISDILGELPTTRSEDAVVRLQSTFSELTGSNKAGAVIEFLGDIGRTVEEQARMGAAIRALKDGFNFDEAVEISFQGLFDYTALTNREKQVFRRLFPFYTYRRKNTALQIRTLLTNPGRQANKLKVFRQIREDTIQGLTSEQKEALNLVRPLWEDRLFALPVGVHPTKGVMFLTGIGMPMEDMMDISSIRGLGFQLNPAIRLTNALASRILQSTERGDLFPFKEKYEVSELRGIFSQDVEGKITPAQINRFLYEAEKGYYGSFNQAVQKLFGFQVARFPIFEKGKVVRYRLGIRANASVMDVLRSAPIARGLSTFKMLQDPDYEEEEKFLRFMTGLQMYRQSIERQRAISRRFQREMLSEAVRRSGEGYPFELIRINRDSPELRELFKRINRADLTNR